MKKLLLICLLIVGCEQLLDADVTAPTVVIAYPSNGNILTEPTMVRANATDDTGIESITFLINGIEVFTDTESPYEYEWDVCVSGTGTTPTITVKATDSADNTGQSEVYTYTINATYDCLDVCGGGKVADNCGTCDADATNDCTADCNGDHGGEAYTDECDDCVGGNTALTACLQDDCGVWGGDNSPLTGTCDCASTPYGDATTDMCGKCDADTTNDCIQDCADVWGGASNCDCIHSTAC
ncbi:uncharacterized protein METZ01_LOCUS366157, partial [marine metagenome]